MKHIKHALIIFCCIITLNSCNPEPYCDKVITVNIKDLHKYVPYTGTETLRFLHNSTDTQTFVGQGMERFYVRCCKNSDADCSKDQESVRIRFKNPQTQDEIKMEFKYVISTHMHSFYYNNILSGGHVENLLLTKEINGITYNNIVVFSTSQDTPTYILYRSPSTNNQYSGILKVKYPGDTLTILR